MSDDMATTIERETAQRSARPSPVSPEQPAAPGKPGGRKRTVFMIMGVVLLGLVAVGVRGWICSLSQVSTDNAQVDGHIVPILPKVGGYVVDVRTDENRPVKAGDTLVVLDDRDYKARLAQAEADLAVALAGVSNRARVGQAEAQVAQAQAKAEKAHADLGRIKPLAEKDIGPKQALDEAEAGAPPAGARGGAAPGPPLQRAWGEPVAGHRSEVLTAAARQRDRELHEGRAADPRADPARREERPRASAPAGDECGRAHQDQVSAPWPPPLCPSPRSPRMPTGTGTATSSRSRCRSRRCWSCSTPAL